MIKLKIISGIGDNYDDISNMGTLRRCFSAWIYSEKMLHDYSIEIVRNGSNDYDYELIDKRCWQNRKLGSLEKSIEKGINFLSKRTGDYFLIDGGDCTSLMASIEVLRNSNAKMLLKKHVIAREDYAKSSFLGRWWFGVHEDQKLNVSYDISKEEWKKIGLCGHNNGHEHVYERTPSQLNNIPYNSNGRDIDICAIWQGIHPPNLDYGDKNDKATYTHHRVGCWDELKKIENKIKIVKDFIPYNKYLDVAFRSKIGISPYGMGELCFRDYELVQAGCLLIKPNMGSLITAPNWLVPNETYIPVKTDWSDLNETINKILNNFKDYEHIIINAQKRLHEVHKLEHFCMHQYKFFSNLDGITNG